MSNIIIIQARTGSTRLPNKVLTNIEGKTDLEWVVNRVSKSKLADDILVATTINKSDLPIVKLCADLGIRVFCGSENDVLDRYYQAARLLEPDNVIRITADCPLHDAEIIDLVIQQHLDTNSDYTSNVIEETYPDGLDCEVFKFQVLEETWKMAKLASQREHVTQYMIHDDKYKKYSVVSEDYYGNERWTLDTEEDLEFIRAIYRELISKKRYFNYRDVLQLLSKKPELRELNKGSIRNEGLKNSIKNDYIMK